MLCSARLTGQKASKMPAVHHKACVARTGCPSGRTRRAAISKASMSSSGAIGSLGGASSGPVGAVNSSRRRLSSAGRSALTAHTLAAPAVRLVAARQNIVAKATVADDAVLFWNGIALDSVAVDIDRGSSSEAAGPVLGARALAIVHLAILEAYNGASGRNLPSYLGSTDLPPPPTPIPSNNFTYRLPAIAATGAAHAVLTSIFTAQRQMHDAALEQARAALRSSESGGVFETYLAYGRAVAEKVLLLRRDDPVQNIVENLVLPGTSGQGFTPELYDGGYRPAPGADNRVYAPRYGFKSRLFSTQKRYGLREPSEFAAGNSVLADDVEFLNWKGSEPSQLGSIPEDRRRTEEETQTGLYWAYDGPKRLGTPPRLYNQVVRQVAIARGNSELQNASLFALANIAMADAGILAWQQKYKSFYYRPATGLPANGVRNWKPLGAPRSNQTDGAPGFTPNFPAYPSGHATFGAAALHTLRLFYPSTEGGAAVGDRKADRLLENLTFVSDELDGRSTDSSGKVRPRVPRKHPGGLWEMIVDNGFSRVFLGVHWSFDAFSTKTTSNGLGREADVTSPGANAIGGVPLGLTIAEDIWQNATKATVDGTSIAVPKKSSAPAAVRAYVIQKGDTLFEIATRFGTTVDDLRLLNPETFKNPDLILVGQMMLVPEVSPASS